MGVKLRQKSHSGTLSSITYLLQIKINKYIIAIQKGNLPAFVTPFLKRFWNLTYSIMGG